MLHAFRARMHMCTHAFHHLFVTHAHPATVYQSRDSLTRRFFYLFYLAAVVLVRIGCTQGHGYGMGAETFNMGGKMKQFLFINIVGMDSLNRKDALGKRACLVEHYGRKARQSVHIVSAFYQYSLSRCAADAAKKA